MLDFWYFILICPIYMIIVFESYAVHYLYIINIRLTYTAKITNNIIYNIKHSKILKVETSFDLGLSHLDYPKINRLFH